MRLTLLSLVTFRLALFTPASCHKLKESYNTTIIYKDLLDSVSAVYRFILARNAGSKNQGYRKQNRDRGKKLSLEYSVCNFVELRYSAKLSCTLISLICIGFLFSIGC